jgi:hypothetical protein
MPLNLIIDDLVKGSTFIEKGVEFDDVRILGSQVRPPC